MRSARFLGGALLVAVATSLGGCSLAPTFPHDPTENFSVAKYGPASSRVVAFGQPVPKGGGRYHVGQPYQIAGKTYIPREDAGYSQVGEASWYGYGFHGRETANGEVFDVDGITAAHPTLPLPSYVRVTNLENRRSMTVRVNDRGPFVDRRIIDVSRTVARMLDFEEAGTAKVRVEYVGPAPLEGDDSRMLVASYRQSAPAGTSQILVAAAPPAPPQPSPRPATTASAAIAPVVRLPASTVANDPIAPLILRSASSYSAVSEPTPAQEAAEALARSDLSAKLAIAAANRAAQLGLR